MSKILGLDLGTNSIGWAVVEREDGELNLAKENGQPTKGVIIFPEGVNIEAKTGSMKSRASERTGFRSARRLKFRRKLRKYETLLVLVKNGMCPLSIDDVELWKSSGFKKYPENEDFLNWLKTDDKINKNPYQFRDKFSRNKYDWENKQTLKHELGRAIYHMAQRRGFKSNRLEQSDENAISDFKDQFQLIIDESTNTSELHIEIEKFLEGYELNGKKNDDLDNTQQKIKSILNYAKKVVANKVKGKDYNDFNSIKIEIDRYINRPENLGAVKKGIKELSEKIKEAKCDTLGQYFWYLYQGNRNDIKNKIRTLYTDRENHYEEEFNRICETQSIPKNLKIALYKALFFQRPLKSQKGLVGKCTFENNKPRCPISRPEFEEFRMWSFINNIKIKTAEDESLRRLNEDEIEKIIPRFYLQRSTFKMQDLANELFPKGVTPLYYKDSEAKGFPYVINYKLNTTISGSPVSAAFKKILGEDWKTKTYTYQTLDDKGNTVTRNVDYKDLWHILFTYEDEKKLKDFAINNIGLSKIEAQKFCKIPLSQGYASLSLKAISNILPWLKKGLKYSHAVFMANLGKVIKEKYWKDAESRSAIEAGIGSVLDNHNLEVKKQLAVNSLIKTYKTPETKAEISDEAEEYFRKDLEEKLSSIFGKKFWAERENKDELLNDAFEQLKKQMKKINSKDAFLKIKRIDDSVKDFLLDNDFVKGAKKEEHEKTIKNLYHPSDLESFKPVAAKDKNGNEILVKGEALKLLPLPKSESIKNPILMRAMHQLRKLINELLLNGVIEPKTRIHIELAREVNDINKRKAWKEWQDELRNKRENAVTEIKKLYKAESGKEIEPSEDDVLRYLLWEEQGKKEIYELNSTNISICDIVGPDPKYDIEHTIPRSRSWDNSMMNKTLCSKKFNREEKKNQIPSELDNHSDILQRIEHWEKKYNDLDNQIKKINASNITDIEAKNRAIVKRHVLTFERNYLKGKHERFIMKQVPEGFKNSQTTDTGLITRFARNYLSCLFRTHSDNSNVRVVNGVAVSEFRKAWGIQKEYEKKSRANHIHHCMDAVTVACMTKDKYDAFAEEWRKAEEESKYDVKNKFSHLKPWSTFTEDVLNLQNEVLIVHAHKDNVPKQTKKKLRKRGRIQYLVEYQKDSQGNFIRDEKDNKKPAKDANGKIIYKLDKKGNRIPIYQQGDTARGSLHQDTFYGAIKLPEIDDKTGKPLRNDDGSFVLKTDKKGNDEVKYVVRKKLSDLSDSDLDKIIDPTIKEISKKGRVQEKSLKKEIESLNKELKKAENEQEAILKTQIKKLKHQIENELYIIPPKKGKNIFTPIKKVRIKAHLSEPLPEFKQHRDKAKNIDGTEKHPHKKWIYAQNERNYCLAIYENNDQTKRAALSVRLIDAIDYFKESNKIYRKNHPLIPDKNGMNIKGFLKPNTLVLLYENHPEELWDLKKEEKRKRLYFVRKTNKDGRITLQYHQEARNDDQLKTDYENEFGVKPPASLTNGESSVDFEQLPIPKLLLSPLKMTLLIEGFEFKLTTTGDIVKV
ncbi:MAG: type II CRISPR RNA-guided endonuclease Cas9 [Chitinophagales bacterium]